VSSGARCKSEAISVVIGLIKRVHLRDEFFDAEKKRVRAEKAADHRPHGVTWHWYCKTSDRFEMKRPD